MKLAIGTAQFGLNYGIANASGIVPVLEVEKIIALARLRKIDVIDTAILYGDSEKILGQVGVADFKVVSKLPKINKQPNESIFDWVKFEVEKSLSRLKVNDLYALLLHYPYDLDGHNGDQLYEALNILKKLKYIQKFGVSIYSQKEISYLDRYAFDLVQVPTNPFNRIFLNSFSALKDKNIEIHVRSIFLQGLLLMSKNQLPDNFLQYRQHFNKWHDWLASNDITAIEACVRFSSGLSNVSNYIVGVDGYEQFKEIVEKSELGPINLPESLTIDDEKLINPNNW